ncbi:deoxycytidylate deaminase [Proteus vulgaris]|uniref:anti-phage dCTP deaminase n=1 Tax=Proteus vulgaris TaxID=585 RepID=UPI0025571A8D|nr:anti-phage dCTP deaminase [Proteus vulgaris]GLX65518.1 deoxycytidylate deaminase [Proteus vulgaris]
MGSPAKVVEIANNAQIIEQNDEVKDVELKIKNRQSNELIIALCGLVGSGVRKLKDSLIEEFENLNYKVKHIRISELIAEQQEKPEEIKKLTGYSRYETLQNLGDELRKSNTNNICAQLAIRRINIWRDSVYGEKLKENERPKHAKTLDKIVYIIDQLKNPAEVSLFRTVYKNNFYLIGLLRNSNERERNLKDDGLDDSDIKVLMSRDRKNKDSYGQQVEDTIQLSDYFIRNIEQIKEINNSVKRFISLVHGVNHITPTRDETGIFTAYNSSLRSACLSRQVGACIVDDNGNILSTGCNDVPRFNGGLYTSEDSIDNRCHNSGRCFNDLHKSILKKQITEILQLEGIEDPERLSSKIMKSTKAKYIIEYSRAIHAEMDAIMSLARSTSVSTVGKTMYCTTYPCHNCARHIVAAGIKRVVYIEPYEKSLARDLHNDAICHTDDITENKVLFANFEGVSPSRYPSFFRYHGKRKDDQGYVWREKMITAKQVDPSGLDSYFDYEAKTVADVNALLGEERTE